jgi:hypothetical protein
LAAVYNENIMKAVVEKYFGEGKYHTVDGTLLRTKPGGQPEIVYDASVKPAKPTAGWQKTADGKGWEPVPGGPHDPKTIETETKAKAGAVKLPSEVAGRLALMHEAVKDFPSATEALMKNRGAYGIDKSLTVAEYAGNFGEVGRAKRVVRTAIEGALRAMTGAAAPEQEVSRYLDMFMPGVTDSPETAKQKIGLLHGFIDRATQIATNGQQDQVPGLNKSAPPSAPLLQPGQSKTIGNVKIERMN